ncbi:MAG: nucleotidyltransferase domain-containing protein [Candidatus Omnitrophota bacterium]
MVEEKQVKVVNALKELLDAQGIKPFKIIVFGSAVKGYSNSDSDVDIVVLSKRFNGKDIFEKVEMTKGIHRKLIKKLMIPVDVMYCSSDEWGKSSSPIIEIVKKEGRVFS